MSAAGVTITPREYGPCPVAGRVSVGDADGAKCKPRHETQAIRRYGASTNQPCCNGTHSGIGFSVAEQAVRHQDEQEGSRPLRRFRALRP